MNAKKMKAPAWAGGLKRAHVSAVLALAALWGGQAHAVAPTVSITSPTPTFSATGPALVSIKANAADSDGRVVSVEFYNGSALLGRSTTGTATTGSTSLLFGYDWQNVAAGTYSITAKATDDTGAVTTSSVVQFAVNGAPSVSMTSPSSGAMYAAPAAVTLTAEASDRDGSITKVEFYNGSALLSTVTSGTAVGTSTAIKSYSYNWSNVPAGTYGITARAYDNKGAVSASTVQFTVNAAPSVSLTAPVGSASYTAPASIAITANAGDGDGSIAKVEFYNGTALLGTVTSGVGDANLPAGVAKYQFNWTNVAAGSYSLTAKAYDNRGAVTTSGRVAVTVAASTAPTVSLTSPAANASYTAPATVNLAANASNPDGTAVAKVEFYSGTTLLNSDTTAPYSYSWANVAAGSYSITAKAYNSAGVSTTSTAVAITVKAANAAPTVSLTAPAANASYTAPASVTITANAADSDGTISKVEFYNGATLLNSDTTAPYSYSWVNVAAGSHSLTAKAYDNAGAITTSAAVAITVSPAPVAATTLYFVHPDHLGTPRMITDSAKKVVWRWDNAEAFGSTGLQEDPDGDTKKFTFNLRFAGQYYDLESGLHYNRNRDYDPATGRYVQADPIGLNGGISLYGYVSGNPLSFVDPLGLAKCDETTRVRHYTNRKGSNAIEEEGVIRARDNNRVYVESANQKPLNQVEAESKYQIKQERGRDYVETDVESSRLEWVKNPRYGTEELTVKGDVTLQNSSIVRRR